MLSGEPFASAVFPFSLPGLPDRMGMVTDETRNLYQIGFILLSHL